MKKVMGLVIGLLPVYANAQCVTPPDCTSIGYTETSCDGDSLKCPFDTTKLYCPPCDSSFRHTCMGEGVKKSIGNACNGKYVACECDTNAGYYYNNNGECLCDTSCDTMGNIYYSDGTCSSCIDENKTIVGITALSKNNKIYIINLEQDAVPWAVDQVDGDGNIIIAGASDITDLYSITTNTPEATHSDYNGVGNTKVIVEHFGENATGVAAVFCYNYAPPGLESSKGEWYLPAAGEIYEAFNTSGPKIKTMATRLGTTIRNRLWTSTGYVKKGAWLHYYNGYSYSITGNLRSSANIVPLCFKAIN